MSKTPIDILRRIRADPDRPGYMLVGDMYGGYVRDPDDWDRQPVAEIVQEIVNAAKTTSHDDDTPLLNARFEVQSSHYDGWHNTDITIRGDRRATAEEVEDYKPWKAEQDAKRKATNAKKRENEQRQAAEKKARDDAKALARVRASFPDLLREPS
jgi:hypothetical protein